MNDQEDPSSSLLTTAVHQIWRRLQYTSSFNSTSSSIYNDHEIDFASFDSSSSSNGGGGGHSRDAYEFVAFLLWYLFLVLCCVIPTCCAYRRRRLVEARIAQQQASVNRIERQNLFILSSLRQSQQNTERIREQRIAKITEQLKDTTMTVEESDIIDISGEENNVVMPRSTVTIVDEPPPVESNATGDNIKDDDDSNNHHGSNGPMATVAVEYDVEAADPESTHALRLVTQPAQEDGQEPTTRLVAGACAICLCPYEPDDQVTWSPKEACQHAFHSDCIIPWLAKTEEPKCPCCRQDYCDPVPISQLEVDPIGIFGAPNSFAGLMAGGEVDDMVIPHFMRTLEASRLEFLASLELAAVEASGRTPMAIAYDAANNAITTNNNNNNLNDTTDNVNTTNGEGETNFDGSPFEGASEEVQASGSGNNNTNEEDGVREPFDQEHAVPTPGAENMDLEQGDRKSVV